MWERLQALERRYDELAEEMARQEVATDFQRYQELAKEQAALAPAVQLYRRYKALQADLAGARSTAEDNDPDIRELANEEIAVLEEQLAPLTEQLRLALLPRDPNDDKNVILEVRGAEGGEEAA